MMGKRLIETKPWQWMLSAENSICPSSGRQPPNLVDLPALSLKMHVSYIWDLPFLLRTASLPCGPSPEPKELSLWKDQASP